MKLLQETDPSRGLLRVGVRLPIVLYKAHLGRFLGERFLMLTSVGRKTGVPHETVLEVVLHEKETDTYYVASGWGEKADWFRNIRSNSEVLVKVGTREFKSEAILLSPPESERLLKIYASQHPLAAQLISKLITGVKSTSIHDQVAALAETIPLVAIQPLNSDLTRNQ